MPRRMLLPIQVLALAMGLTAGCALHSSTQTPLPATARQYLELLDQGVARARAQLPAMTKSAEIAADHVCSGSAIYVAGTQKDFVDELIGRAGGLMGLRPLAQVHGPLNPGDVVLYGSRGGLSIDDDVRIDHWREGGVYVVGFASRKLAASSYFHPDLLLDSGDSAGLPVGNASLICPTDSVCNIIDAWTWTGEFVAACTRRGKMPICYESYHLPGGYARAAKYRKLGMFHDHMQIKPIASGLLGGDYLDQLHRSLTAIANESVPNLVLAGQWVRETPTEDSTAMFMAHMFPQNFNDPRTPQPFGHIVDLERNHPVPQASLVCAIGYQEAPRKLVAAARLHRFRLIYTSVGRIGTLQSDDIIYINPHWPMSDGCVTLPGYDIPVLPESGVMQAAIYWSIVAEAS